MKICKVYFVLIVSFLLFCIHETKYQENPSNDQIAAFYHVAHTHTGTHNVIIKEQLQQLNDSGLLPLLSAVYYGVIHKQFNRKISSPDNGNKPSKLILEGEKFHNIGYWSSGYEMKTLGKLYDFCKLNPSYKILYFHMKGGEQNSITQINTRRVLNVFTLHKNCIRLLDKYDTCGWRLSPLPYVHYSGNFWWSKCSYINTLIDPKLMNAGSQKQISDRNILRNLLESDGVHMNYGLEAELTCLGLGRYFAEAWIGSGTYLNAADCLPHSIAPHYLFGPSIPMSVITIANDVYDDNSKRSQITCGPAATNASAHIFQEVFNSEIQPCSKVNMTAAKNMLWYNVVPQSLIQWRKKFHDEFKYLKLLGDESEIVSQ